MMSERTANVQRSDSDAAHDWLGVVQLPMGIKSDPGDSTFQRYVLKNISTIENSLHGLQSGNPWIQQYCSDWLVSQGDNELVVSRLAGIFNSNERPTVKAVALLTLARLGHLPHAVPTPAHYYQIAMLLQNTRQRDLASVRMIAGIALTYFAAEVWADAVPELLQRAIAAEEVPEVRACLSYLLEKEQAKQNSL